MKKIFLRMVRLACPLIFLLAALSCGGDELSKYSSLVVSLEADSTVNVEPGQIVTLTAKVTKDGDPAWGQKVTFTVQTPSGGSFSPRERETDSNGEARTLYTVSSSKSADIIQASLSNDAIATVTLTKTGIARIASITASPTSVVKGRTSIITANVTDGTKPLDGEVVTFTIPINASGAGFVDASGVSVPSVSVTTNAVGDAVAVYLGGSNSPGINVYDTVRGALTNGSSTSVEITRSDAGFARIASIAASPTSVVEGRSSIITVNVTDETKPLDGEVVTFTIPINASGASFVNASGVRVPSVSVTTDAGGKAVAVYLGGSNSPGINVYDTVRAALTNGSSTFVEITRIAGVSGYVVTVTANPSTLTSLTGSSIVTANVKDNKGIGASDIAVAFSTSGAGGLQPATASATTGASGNANAVFTGAASGTVVVQASATINGTTYTGAVAITIP